MKTQNFYPITMPKEFIRILCILTLIIGIGCLQLMASSHREAPLISNDPLADNVDLYAFRSPDNPDMVTIIATYVPMQLPQGGPNYYNFGENVRYEIHVDNDAAIAGDEIIYRFTFDMVHEDPSTFFYVRLGAQNNKYTYTMERSLDGGVTFETVITDGYVPPNNIGPRSIQGGAGLDSDYNSLFTSGITTTSSGEVVFAGPSDDPFFVDLGGIFDLGNAPRQVGDNVDGLACMNVSTIAIQVPISTLLKNGAPSTPENILDPNYVIGVWASASRPAITTLSSTANPDYDGDWVQVSRLGMPLTNEAVIPVGQKDFWNRITPYDEIGETTLDEYFFNPELALYMDDDLFGGAVPSFTPLRIQTASLGGFDFSNGADGLYGLKGNPALEGTALDDNVFGTLLLPAPGKPRSVDLWPAFHTGVPNVRPYQLATGKGGDPLAAGKPFVNNFLPNGGDMLRLNMAVPPTPRDDENFSSLGLIQAAVLGLTAAPYNTSTDIEFIPNMDGFPNGRRLEDDVTRIELQAVSGAVLAAIGLWYDDYDPATSPSPLTQDLIDVLTFTTGVESNDRDFTATFPYVAQPASGTGDCSGRVYSADTQEDAPTALKDYFVSSNTQAKAGLFTFNNDRSFDNTSFAVRAGDADGVHYDAENDILYQLNRSANVIDIYGDVLSNVKNGLSPSYITSSTSDFSNGREIAVIADKLVVAQDANDGNGQINQFVIYDITTNTISLDRILTTDINLWGIQFAGNTLYAIVDNASDLARFDSFLSNAPGSVSADAVVTIESMIRTHGIAYDVATDMMVLTDVGAASSPTDGAVLTIANYTDAASDGVITDDEQIRLEGSNTQLGNPVDVAYDAENQTIVVAERASDGGKVIAFDQASTDGNPAPSYVQAFAGASAILLAGTAQDYMLAVTGDFFVSSNTSGLIGATAILEDRSTRISLFPSANVDADGIYYNDDTDVLIQLNRTDNVLNAYADVKASLAAGNNPTLIATSTSDFINGREITVAGDFVVVAQDANDANGQTNKYYVYQYTSTGFDLKNTYDADINLWGIQADINTMYAIVDNSSDVAIYNDFFLNEDGPISADAIVSVENLVRTHGIFYDTATDIMVLTDVAAASDAADGGLVIINNWSMASADGNISADEQTRIAGPSTGLGNPVDVALDVTNNSIYVAERANEGGRILSFDLNAPAGDTPPISSSAFAGASAVYLTGSTPDGNPITSVVDINGQTTRLIISPNPSSEFFQIMTDSNDNVLTDTQVNIYGVDGKLVKTAMLYTGNEKINIQELIPGQYFVSLENQQFSSAMNIIKQ